MNQLLDRSKPGDIAFLYYAGHGSQVKNSLSPKADHLDESIVPADAWQEGIADIRDKELSQIFNRFLDKGVSLTVIFDCCHSGSISRGPNPRAGKIRYVPQSNWDAHDGSRPLTPENRAGDHFLIFSAAQSDENAAEIYDDNGIAQGVFTSSFLHAIAQHSVGASAKDIFYSARALVKASGASQEPIIGGSPKRQGQTLFGSATGRSTDLTSVPVSSVQEDIVRLEAGLALGLSAGVELSPLNEKDGAVTLSIDTVINMNQSLAKLIKGKIEDVHPGEFFQVTSWISRQKPLLSIYIPQNDLSEDQVIRFIQIAKELRRSPKIKWISSLNKSSSNPYESIFWLNNSCFRKVDIEEARPLAMIDAQSILREAKKDSTLYVELPLAAPDCKKLRERFASSAYIGITDNYAAANYVLFGTLNQDGLPVYGLRKKMIKAKDSLEALPIETDCFLLSGTRPNFADSLYDRAARLAKIRGWMDLQPPSADQSGFAYDLYMYDEDKKQPIDSAYQVGSHIRLGIRAADRSSDELSNTAYLYIFVIDQSGKMELLFPSNDGNDQNKFPQAVDGVLVKDYSCYRGTIGPPSGTDNYFLLATAKPISNPQIIFQQNSIYSGIRKRDLRGNNPLADLLDMGNEGGSRAPLATSFNWSIQKLSIRCSY
jgi:hypothetical protein